MYNKNLTSKIRLRTTVDKTFGVDNCYHRSVITIKFFFSTTTTNDYYNGYNPVTVVAKSGYRSSRQAGRRLINRHRRGVIISPLRPRHNSPLPNTARARAKT